MEKLLKFKESLRQFRASLIRCLEKPAAVCKTIFGYGIMISLFLGGITVLGYLFAIIVGGDIAAQTCAFIKGYIVPAVTYMSTISVLFGLVIMYMTGQSALSAKKKSKVKTEEKLKEGER